VVMAAESKINTKRQQQMIMIIQNDFYMQELLDKGLNLDDHDVIIASSEDEALRILDNMTPDMIIMNTITADAHSLHILDSVKDKSSIPVIVITSDNEMDTLKKIFDHGADDIMHKPVSMRVLIARIRAILRRWYPFDRVTEPLFSPETVTP
jgi:DNA-binding response OmpR family regulator